jgi:hypothetical protein
VIDPPMWDASGTAGEDDVAQGLTAAVTARPQREFRLG